MKTKPANQKVEHLAIDSIQPYPRNPRLHSEANVAKLVASIKAGP